MGDFSFVTHVITPLISAVIGAAAAIVVTVTSERFRRSLIRMEPYSHELWKQRVEVWFELMEAAWRFRQRAYDYGVAIKSKDDESVQHHLELMLKIVRWPGLRGHANL